jgi:hypothetical protein
VGVGAGVGRGADQGGAERVGQAGAAGRSGGPGRTCRRSPGPWIAASAPPAAPEAAAAAAAAAADTSARKKRVRAELPGRSCRDGRRQGRAVQPLILLALLLPSVPHLRPRNSTTQFRTLARFRGPIRSVSIGSAACFRPPAHGRARQTPPPPSLPRLREDRSRQTTAGLRTDPVQAGATAMGPRPGARGSRGPTLGWRT